MDFLDPKKKRQHAIRLFIGYGLMAVAIFLATVLLLFAALGYGINRSTGEVTQNGLVFVDAHPEQARIYINGVDKGDTDGRYVLEAGKYTLELRHDGYRTWKRDFTVEGGGIVRLVYPFLFPNNLATTDVSQLNTTDLATASPDRHWIVMHSPEQMNTFQVVDTSAKQNVVTPITVPTAVFGTHTGQKLELAEWSTDNKHVLLKYLYDGGFDYIILDRDAPQNTVNITQAMGRGYTTVQLRDKKPDALYAFDATTGLLQTVNLKDKSTATVVEGIASFWPYKDDTIVYVTTKDAPAGKVNVHIKEAQTDYLLRDLVAGPKYLLNMAEFDSNTYVTVGSSADGKEYIYQNPVATLKKKDTALNVFLLLRLDNPEFVSFSNNTRFIALQAGSKFEIYDAETKQQYRYDTGLKLEPSQKATWMDGHRLMLISEGKMRVFDYDDANPQTLVDANAGFIPMFDRDYNNLFTISPNTSDPTKLRLAKTDINIGQK